MWMKLFALIARVKKPTWIMNGFMIKDFPLENVRIVGVVTKLDIGLNQSILKFAFRQGSDEMKIFMYFYPLYLILVGFGVPYLLSKVIKR